MQLFGGARAAKKAGEGPAPSIGGDGVVKDGSLRTFEEDVLQASMQTPVLVDFWAPWCGPCKQLTPLLEKVVRATKGKVRLVKINIDDNPEIAQQLRIQSVPTVYAFVQGQPVTGFTGAQPESQVKALVERLMGAPVGADLVEALATANELADQGDAHGAAEIYEAIIGEEPGNADAIGGLARCLLTVGKTGEAQRLLDDAPKEIQGHAAVSGARAALALALEAGELGDAADLAARVERDAADHDARYRLATLLFLRGQVDPAIEHLLQIVRRDRAWNEDQARRQLVRFFDALGPKSPATLKGRRMLSTVLFS